MLSSNASAVPVGAAICLGNEEAPFTDSLDRILAFNECLQQHPHDALEHILIDLVFALAYNYMFYSSLVACSAVVVALILGGLLSYILAS